MEYRVCTICDGGGIAQAVDVRQIRANVRQFRDEMFTVWRCPSCRSLHCLEDIDEEKYYQWYPPHNQRSGFFTEQLFRARLRQLAGAGLKKDAAVLDYGCGNGGFVEFLRAEGYGRAEGFDPHSERFQDRAVLGKSFDAVVCQDVLEHACDPASMLDEILGLVSQEGMVVIGTPDASRIDLEDPMDAVGSLHQPYHRHLLTLEQLGSMLAVREFRIVQSCSRWYVDTWVPFLNSRFFFGYLIATGGSLDAIYEPVQLGVLLRSPCLLVAGLFGRLWSPEKDMLVVARRCSR